MKNLEIIGLKELNEEELNCTNGGIWQWVAGAVIWALWEVFDSPDDFKSGFKDGIK